MITAARKESTPKLQRTCACGGSCSSCSGKRKVHRAATHAAPDHVPQLAHDVLRDPGRPLDLGARASLEPWFGHDFSSVRVHDDANADAAARSVNARAYTVGQHIVFSAGHYAPATDGGRRLLAHELTHVVQQRAFGTSIDRATAISDPADESEREAEAHADAFAAAARLRAVPATMRTVQRAPVSRIHRLPADFQVRGLDRAAAPNLIFFELASAAIDPSQNSKITTLASPAGRALDLHGFTSEEGPAAVNATLANQRIAAVDSALAAAGHTGPRNPFARPLAGAGRIDYRRLRAVEVTPAGDPSSVPNCSGAAPFVTCGVSPNAFDTAQSAADTLLGDALTALGPPVTPAMSTLLTTFFTASDPATASDVATNLAAIRAHVSTNMTPENLAGPGHRCATICNASCRTATAFNNGSGPTATMTLCPRFMAIASAVERGSILIHEGAHGTSSLRARDHAYQWERRIVFLNRADSLANADSYLMLVRNLRSPGSVSRGPTAPDVTPGLVPGSAQDVAVRSTMAWLQKFMIWASQQTASLYSSVNDRINSGSWPNPFYLSLMSALAPLFTLTVPPAAPTEDDKAKLAAINDRYQLMRTPLRGPITLTSVAAGPTTWDPGPGTNVTLGPSFFAVATTPRQRLDQLIDALIAATPGITAALRPSYAQAAEIIRVRIGGGTP